MAVTVLGFQLALILWRKGGGDKMVHRIALSFSIFSLLTKTNS